MDLVLRFLIGGAIVSGFAIIGDLLKPRSFAGLFGAAPSIAVATLALAVAKDGSPYAAAECHSMLLGAIGLGFCAWVACQMLVRLKLEPLPATLYGIGVWFAVSFGLWWAFLR